MATLKTGRPGPTPAFRVDMDALDLSEAQDNSHRPFRDGFASCNPGMMHACAHDGHTTIGLGLAQVLKQNEAQLNGTIRLIFQPAEEGTRGARAMVAAGRWMAWTILLPSISVPACLPERRSAAAITLWRPPSST